MVPYSKPYKTASDLVTLLQARGLAISDTLRAERYISNIGYYRLSAYMFPFLLLPKTDHKFKVGVSFDNVLDLYRFDKKLRVLIFNEVEKVEIAVREAIVNVTAEMSGDKFWITSPSSYKSGAFFKSTMEKIDTEYNRSTEDFIEHFKKTYSNPYPPAWILAEILPMGNLMQLFRNLSDQRIRKAIAHKFGMQAPLLESWMTTLTLTRNACCHHSRVWNKVNAILPASPKKISGPWISTIPDQRRVYYNLCILRYFLIQIAPSNDLTNKLKELFTKFHQIDLSAMGFPNGWDNEPLWK